MLWWIERPGPFDRADRLPAVVAAEVARRARRFAALWSEKGDALRVETREKSQKIAKKRHRFLDNYADSKSSYGQKWRFKVGKITTPVYFGPGGGDKNAARGGLSELAKFPHIGQG
jgi:hypothetical protein